ncbi:methylenetetrahydrofolate reductase-domain-containing protein [Polychytrium aggregatum]|uniref:methylenetetrahydrofolate reductase-domain-containing protein n=1 Tax=Polychytrium aggregatum TaxID=110093 RepID=UPI0022FF0EFC|nr:methylenetetrahydrofolate reductase-domain-containing protein [Polychytrium aggregatum]KAI9206932.1 methylenetetrahydrofolate reductase-domain-containing protein [Polychytrium aggregatum]
MKVTQKIERAEAEGRDYWSFEYFPPKTEIGVANLYDRMERMYTLGPEFIDVTWGAGGTSSDLTMQICNTAQAVYGLETCMHLTCTNMPRQKIDDALREAKNNGIQNILALRGDPPRGVENWEACDTGFAYASDLVKYIRAQYGDYFCIAYPEGHIDNSSKEDDMQRLKYKVECGADYIVTQLFYDVPLYLSWLKEVRALGITIPILPGIMPIQNYGGFKRMTTLAKTYVPDHITEAIEPIKDDDNAIKQYGIRLAVDMCKALKAGGVRGFHFYTLNLERSVRLILEGLGFVAPIEVAKPLPWNPSLAKNREKENVRPIFWKNRTRSYILRTEAWDDFPNGRWGDARSPAFGDLDGYGASLKHTPAEALKLWDSPATKEDLYKLFSDYCNGTLVALPWSDSPLFPESEIIRAKLAAVNGKGFLTINSQPAVDGAPSTHPVYGWGPKNGFVYQKSYLEFFVAPEALDALVKKIEGHPFLTYYAVNRQGDLRTNNQSDSPNAVTWGVFPGQEIIQPTIVEAVSFLAWKDEAYELWNKWEGLYEASSASAKLIREISSTWFLVNLVDNNFKDDQAIFELFDL